MGVRPGQGGRGVGEVPDLGIHAGVLGDGEGFAEGRELFVGFRALGFVGDGQVREDAHHAQQALVLEVHGFAHEAVPGIQGRPVAAQSGVHFEVHAGGPFLLAGGRHNAFQFPARAADVDAGGHGGAEVALRGVQPGQQGRLNAGGAQGQGLGDVGRAQPVGAGLSAARATGTAPWP